MGTQVALGVGNRVQCEGIKRADLYQMQIVLSMTDSGFKPRFSYITRLPAVALLSLAAVSTFPANAFAAAGQLDKTFGNGGIFLAPNANFSDSSATSLAIQSDGKIVVAGQ